ERNRDQSLTQRGLNLSAQARAFSQHERELTANQSKPDSPGAPNGQCDHRGGHSVEPARLIEGRSDRKVPCRRRRGPRAVLGVGLDPQPIVARRKVRVESLAASPRINPIRIEAVEAVTESDLVRGGKCERRIADPQAPCPGRELGLWCRTEPALVRYRSFNPNRRSSESARGLDGVYVDERQTTPTDEPESAVRAANRSKAPERSTGKAVRRVVEPVQNTIVGRDTRSH